MKIGRQADLTDMIAGEMLILAQQMAAGYGVDRTRQREVASHSLQVADGWDDLLDQMEDSADFQVLERLELMDMKSRHLGYPGQRAVVELQAWEADRLLADADGLAMPLPPEDVDFSQIRGNEAGPPQKVGCSAMFPFEDVVLSEELEDQYTQLKDDHKKLVQMGETYGGLDHAGKEFYLDQMQLLEGRWSNMFAAARRDGVKPSKAFQSFSEAYLAAEGVTAAGWRERVSEVHKLMRYDAR